MGKPGPCGTDINTPEVDGGTSAPVCNKPPGPDGSAANLPDSEAHAPLLIRLDLAELVDIEDPAIGLAPVAGSHKRQPAIVKGAVLNHDPDRPDKVLQLIKAKFSKLGVMIKFESGAVVESDRFVKVRFGYPIETKTNGQVVHPIHGPMFDPKYIGAGADASSRNTLMPFKTLKGDKGVTAYLYEGALGYMLLDLFQGKSLNINNIIATAIAHELGHNLGLTHEVNPQDIMFDAENRPESEQKQWLILAEKNSLEFTSNQIQTIRKLLNSQSVH
jgi:hypothetical protein